MGSRYEVEVTVGRANNLKNVNWRNGNLKPYAELWVDSGPRVSTGVDRDNGENPSWNEKVMVKLPPSTRAQDAVLCLDVFHANGNAAEGVKPLVVGSARLPLRDVLDDAGVGVREFRHVRLKRPSGRPHGRLYVRAAVREPSRYYDGNQRAYRAPTGPGASRDDTYGGYGGAMPGGHGTGAAARVYGAAAPPAGAGYPASYGSARPEYGAAALARAGYGSAPGSSAATTDVDPAKKKTWLGVGGGLAVAALLGLGGLALADKFEDDVAETGQFGGGGGGDDDGDYDGGDY